MKIYVRVEICLICHIHDNAICFKMVTNVKRATFVAAISGPVLQPSWISNFSLKSKLISTNSLSISNVNNIYLEGNIVNLRRKEAELEKILNFGFPPFSPFSWPTFWKWPKGGHASPNFGLTHWGQDKWTPFRRRNFQTHFSWMKMY